jgi:hypothetical protein
MKKIVPCLILLVLVTSFLGIFSNKCIAVSSAQESNNVHVPTISTTSMGLVTTVRGLFSNFQQSLFTVSFYALRIHYLTTGPFNHEKGVINFKSCTGGTIVGPIKITTIGPLHNIAYGTFTFLGAIHYQ